MSRSKILVSCLATILILVVLVASACQPAATTTPKPTTAPTAAPTATPLQPVTLKFATWTNPTGPFGLSLKWYLDEVEKRSNGNIKFERYWAEALVKSADILDALDAGICDVGTVNSNYYPSKLPLATMNTLSYFAGTKNLFVAHSAFQELYRTNKAMQDELAKYHTRFLAPAGTSAYYLLANKQINTLEDLKGLKARALTAEAVMFQALGGTPVGITTPELYEAMSKGTINGVVFSPSAVIAYKLEEVGKCYFQVPLGGQVYGEGIRQATWDKLPPEYQKIMTDVANDTPKAYHQSYQIDGDGLGYQKMKDKGIAITAPSAADLAAAKKIADATLVKKWIDDNTAKGLPAQQVWDEYLRLMQKYEPLNPYK